MGDRLRVKIVGHFFVLAKVQCPPDYIHSGNEIKAMNLNGPGKVGHSSKSISYETGAYILKYRYLTPLRGRKLIGTEGNVESNLIDVKSPDSGIGIHRNYYTSKKK